MLRAGLLIFALMAVLVATTMAIKCYSCDSGNASGMDCATPGANTLVECGPTANPNNVCYKTMVKAEGTGLARFTRGCGRYTQATTLGDDSCQDLTVSGVSTRVCNCNKDSCNSAISQKASFGALAILLALTAVFVKF